MQFVTLRGRIRGGTVTLSQRAWIPFGLDSFAAPSSDLSDIRYATHNNSTECWQEKNNFMKNIPLASITYSSAKQQHWHKTLQNRRGWIPKILPLTENTGHPVSYCAAAGRKAEKKLDVRPVFRASTRMRNRICAWKWQRHCIRLHT